MCCVAAIITLLLLLLLLLFGVPHMNECLHSVVVVAVVATRHDVSAFNFSTLFFCIVRLTWAGGSWRGLEGERKGAGNRSWTLAWKSKCRKLLCI